MLIKMIQVKFRFLDRRYGLSQDILKISRLIVAWKKSTILKIQSSISTRGIWRFKIKKMYYADDFLIDQNIEASNPPENIETHVCKDREVKLFGANYDLSIEEFSGLCKTVGFIVVRRDDDELFFNCGFDAEKSKILYSHYRRRTPNSFGVKMFNPHLQMIESWELESVQLELFYFLPSITDRSEKIDKYMDNVSLSQLT